MHGIGIVLEFGTGTEHFPVVQNLIPGRAAYACGKITIGDRLVRIGSHSTEYQNFNQVRELIVGPTGSLVTLSFCGASGEYNCENLVRGPLEVQYRTSSASYAACARSESHQAPVDQSATVKSDFSSTQRVFFSLSVRSQSPQHADEIKSYLAAASDDSGVAEVEPELVSNKKGRKKKTKALGSKVENPTEIKETQVSS